METAARHARIGVMGGTFDPLHVGHLVAASETLHAFGLDQIVFMPTGQPWQKRDYSDAEDRYLMTVLGVQSNHRFAVSRMELDRRGPTYTCDTMAVLHQFHGPDARLFFIAGADAVLKLGSWYGIERLGAFAEIIAVTRPGFAMGEVRPEAHWPKIRQMEMPQLEISSTGIRARIATGQPIDYLVPGEVADYIRRNGLYAGAADA